MSVSEEVKAELEAIVKSTGPNEENEAIIMESEDVTERIDKYIGEIYSVFEMFDMKCSDLVLKLETLSKLSQTMYNEELRERMKDWVKEARVRAEERMREVSRREDDWNARGAAVYEKRSEVREIMRALSESMESS